MTAEILKLIAEYQLHVHGFVTAYRNQFGVDDMFGSWMRREIPEKGTLDDRYETRFGFHGVGCCVESERGIVDFDFGPSGRYDGFDGWRLWLFSKSRAEDYPECQRLEVVESILGELVTDDVIVRPGWPPSPHLCYLRSDCVGTEIPFKENKPTPFDI